MVLQGDIVAQAQNDGISLILGGFFKKEEFRVDTVPAAATTSDSPVVAMTES